MQHWRPTLSCEYVETARRHALDVAASIFLFVVASLLAGRVWRFPFDDEIYTLRLIERLTPLQLVTLYPAHADVHPPFSYLVFSALSQLGASVPAMRLASLALTGLALALIHILTLSLIGRRAEADLKARVVAVLLFGLCPLAVSQGDALRWYPLFAALIALFVTLYLAGGNRAARFAAAASLGLAGSTNLLALPVGLAFIIYRYGLQRAFRAPGEIAFWLTALVFGSLGVYSAGSIIFARGHVIGTQLGNGVVRSVLTDLLGFFGGNALGLSRAWIVLPALLMTALRAPRSTVSSRRSRCIFYC